MAGLTVSLAPLAYRQESQPWLPGRQPYEYQLRVYQAVEGALARQSTLCLFLATPTGSGKTLASYAYAIKQGVPAFGVYPTNELIRDQERALSPLLDPRDEQRLLRIDSAQLDYWQDALDLPQHAQALENLMKWEPTVLTNPDILFYAFFGLYRGPHGIGQRLFTLLGRYQLFVFDEFHLYNVKQMADVAFLVGTLQAIAPQIGRVFIFASATPDSPALPWLRGRLQLPVELVEAQPSSDPTARTISHPLELTILPANLRHWRGGEALMEYLPTLQEFVRQYPEARLVTILDSVAGAISTAQALRELFPEQPVGEVHGFGSDLQRTEALQQQFTVGTSTIEVGVDLRDTMEKDLLIFEARTAPAFIQRLGRLGRHEKQLPIPNRAVALVPDYVHRFLAEHLTAGAVLAKSSLYELIRQAYQEPEDFARYIHVHAPAEFEAARRTAESLFQPDVLPAIAARLAGTVRALTGQSGGEARRLHRQYDQAHILQPLLTFRGAGFQAGVFDERQVDPGFPARRYDLLFILRRGVFAEISEEAFHERLEGLSERWPAEVAREQRYCHAIKPSPEELLGVYGFFTLTSLLDKSRKVWFEIGEDQVYGRQAQVAVVTGLEVVTEPGTRLRHLNRLLSRKNLVAWFIDRHPASIKLGRALPPLFEIHELRIRRPGGALSPSPWSIAFNQDAFLVDSLVWGAERRKDRAIVL